MCPEPQVLSAVDLLIIIPQKNKHHLTHKLPQEAKKKE